VVEMEKEAAAAVERLDRRWTLRESDTRAKAAGAHRRKLVAFVARGWEQRSFLGLAEEVCKVEKRFLLLSSLALGPHRLMIVGRVDRSLSKIPGC
jgi:hypothetical protein